MTVPVIDLSQGQDAVVSALMNALTSIGFATLVNHGVPDNVIDRAWIASEQFFSLSESQKLQYKYQGQESNRGYIPYQFEKHEAGLTPDCKETFDIGKESEVGFENFWPRELEQSDFRTDLLRYFECMDRLHLRILKWISIGLKLEDQNFLVDRCNEQHENLRLLHYPSVCGPSVQVRGNIHSDFGTITLLSQDLVGGLKVQTIDGEWIPVAPVQHAIVLNVGDMLMRWSNNRLKANLHQVVTPTTAGSDGETKNIVPERYSIAFFCNANKDTVIECLPTCCDEDPPLYNPITSHDYLTQRLRDTIGRASPEDV